MSRLSLVQARALMAARRFGFLRGSIAGPNLFVGRPSWRPEEERVTDPVFNRYTLRRLSELGLGRLFYFERDELFELSSAGEAVARLLEDAEKAVDAGKPLPWRAP